MHRILYSNCNNQNKLALAWIQLHKYQEAVEAARKANALPTWKAVCFACVDAKEFRLALICGTASFFFFFLFFSRIVHSA